MMVNGKMIIKKEKEFCTVIKVINKQGILELDLMEKEFIIGVMVIDLKEILEMVKEMERELCIIMMEIEKWGIIQMIMKQENM